MKLSDREKMCWQCGKTFHTGMDICPNDGARLLELASEDRSDPLIGTLFDGRFRIYRKLGEGGMGTVYSARRLDFDSDVALKLLKVDFARDDNIRKRFMYEARVISSLQHPHAVRLYDFGQTSEGHFYMVMELLGGESLADRLAYRFVSYQEVFDIVPPICGVLGEAHTKEVIHRDLKPENIFLLKVDGNKEFPKLLDFGIAKHIRAETMTQSGTLWGTPAYMSPEQARGDVVGARADIYGIGIILYELISGNLPFHATTQMGFAVKHINEPARPLSSIPGLLSVPPELDRFVMRLLAKDPAERPETMEEVATTLIGIRERCFDRALLESIPAEEVDPIGLQGWIKSSDVSQQIAIVDSSSQFRAVRAPTMDASADSNASGERAVAAADSSMSSGKRVALMATIAAPPSLRSERLDDEEHEGLKVDGGFGGKQIAIGAAALLVVIALVVFAFNTGDGESVDTVVFNEIPSEPLDMSNVLSVAALQAANIVIEARSVAGELKAPNRSRLIIVDEPEMVDKDGRVQRVRSEQKKSGTPASTPTPGNDRALKKALEQTF
ncbi:MAG: serine/threonine protein kinase [Bradymonadaceae bacterium]|nr:serine/threonine protein kinase [Lujinxingiaceae bacterium]